MFFLEGGSEAGGASVAVKAELGERVVGLSCDYVPRRVACRTNVSEGMNE